MALGVVPPVSADRTEGEQLPRGQLVDRCCQPDRQRPGRSALALIQSRAQFGGSAEALVRALPSRLGCAVLGRQDQVNGMREVPKEARESDGLARPEAGGL